MLNIRKDSEHEILDDEKNSVVKRLVKLKVIFCMVCEISVILILCIPIEK
jgi:hypothetical protein